MARHALARRASPTVIVMPRRGRVRRAARRVGAFARRVRHSRHTPGVAPMSILLGGAAVGWALQKGYLAKLPKVGNSTAITLAAAGYLASKYGRHRLLKAAGYAAMAAGAVGFGKEQGGGTSGLDEHDELDEGV